MQSKTRRRCRRRSRGKQLELGYRTWGGRREGAGRKPSGDKAGVPHTARSPLPSRYPVHVTLELAGGLPSLRTWKLYQELERKVFAVARKRAGFRVVHYSVQRNHIHLIVEAKARAALSKGMQSLGIRLGKAINRLAGGRKGTVFADRYHDRQLTSPTQTRNCLAYVLLNGRKHGEDRGDPRPERWVDPCSSARYFDGWRENVGPPPAGGQPAVTPPATWLLREGWRRGRRGRISILEVPTTAWR